MALATHKIVSIGITGSIHTDQRIQRIANTLAAHHYQVNIYHRTKRPSSIDTTLFAGKSIHIITLQPGVQTGPLFYLLYNFLLFFKLLFKASDAYYAVDADTLPAFTLLSQVKGVPMVYDAHEYFSEVPELSGKQFKKAIWHKVVSIGSRQAKLNLTVGPALAKALSERYKVSFVSIRNLPYAQTISLTEPSNERIIIYQGALNKGRMLETLIEAMPDLPKYTCWIIGEGDLSESLRTQAKGIPNIVFKGLLNPAELKAITPLAYVGFNLLEADDSLSYHYSLSNKFFDYIQAAVPSVSSALPEYIALNESYQSGVCIPNDKQAFIELLKSWEAAPEVHQKLKENAKFAAQSLTWENESKLFIKAFQI